MIRKSLIYRDGNPDDTVSLAEYKIKPCQVVGVVALNAPDDSISIAGDEKLHWQFLIQYQELNWIVRMHLYELLINDGWDFVKYPNPGVFYGDVVE